MNQNHPTLFSPYSLGSIRLRNKIVMAPMTRNRAEAGLPTALMAEYYSSRATAGLIITEGVAPSPNGLGYARIPGLYSNAQIEAWRSVTASVHGRGGKIFVQLMHTGRIAHPLNLPEGAEVIAPSAISASASQIYTDAAGMRELPVPRALRTDELPDLIAEYVYSARSAIAAGFDGIELHAANGYLLDQFLNPASNQREDAYGGSPVRRNRFVLELATAVAAAIGAERTGIRLSPYGVFNDMKLFDEADQQYEALATGLGKLSLAYVHIVDHSSMGAPSVPQAIKDTIRRAFAGPIILSGGYDATRAEAELKEGRGELVAFGRPFISNPDLVTRLSTGAELQQPDPQTFYTPGAKGDTDYPTLAAAAKSALAYA